MTHAWKLSSAAVCTLLVGFSVTTFANSLPSAPQHAHEVRMTAKKYAFDPDVITVHQGERVRLVITALDRDHGFELAAFGIRQKLKKGVPTTIEFTADKAGTFTFRCSEFCGLGHRRMKGKLVVQGD